jgi:hypothetical protein
MPDLSNWGQCGQLVPGDAGRVLLTCRNHPHLRWNTKNIAPIGARNIFFQGAPGEQECDCSGEDLIVSPDQ